MDAETTSAIPDERQLLDAARAGDQDSFRRPSNHAGSSSSPPTRSLRQMRQSSRSAQEAHAGGAERENARSRFDLYVDSRGLGVKIRL
jgi:hypothetical protein